MEECSAMNRTIDSAEAALRNQYYLDYQIRWNPVAKKDKQTMIDFATNLFAQGRFIISIQKATRFSMKNISTTGTKKVPPIRITRS